MNEEGLMQGGRSYIDLWCGRGGEEGEGLGKVGGGGGGEGGEGGEEGGEGDRKWFLELPRTLSGS